MGLGNVDPKYQEWNDVVSEFDQLLWYQHCETTCQIEENPTETKIMREREATCRYGRQNEKESDRTSYHKVDLDLAVVTRVSMCRECGERHI